MKKKYTKLWEKQKECNVGQCICGRTTELTVDHIIPAYLIQQIFANDSYQEYERLYNWEENFEISCKYCNHHKGSKLDFTNKKTIPLLRELLDCVEESEYYKNLTP